MEARRQKEEKDRQAAVEEKKRVEQEEKMVRLQEIEKKRQEKRDKGGSGSGMVSTNKVSKALALAFFGKIIDGD